MQVSSYLRVHQAGGVALFAADRDDLRGSCNKGQGAPRIRRVSQLLLKGRERFLTRNRPEMTYQPLPVVSELFRALMIRLIFGVLHGS